ncbi:MAG: hypothetical protein DRH12_18025 [Deltaproteobacteria bacterium]|nr:MAG: hypothetical protein DRH12_18025 [Deltaproteobacteria bacterium]
MSNKPYKRKQYFIDKSFQTKFILKFCLIVIVSSILIGGILFFLSRNSTTVAIENTKVQVKSTSSFILPLMVETLLVVSIFSAIAVLVLTLFISHKISGPLYRLKKEIDALGNGDLKVNFNIRTGDQLQNLSESLNEMVISLRRKNSELRDKFKELSNLLEDRDFCIADNEREGTRKKLKDLENVLSFFRI